MASIVDSLMSMLGPQIVGPIASRLGESPDAVQKGLQSGSAALLAGIAAKADHPEFLSELSGLLTNPANTSGALAEAASNPASSTTGTAASPLADLGSRFTSAIFGPGQSAVTDAIGNFSGLGAGKAASLLAMASPLVLGFLGQHLRTNNMTATDLAGSLKSEAPRLEAFLPSGFRSLLGVGGPPPPHIPHFDTTDPSGEAGIGRWLIPLLILGAIVIVALWYFNRPKPAPVVATPPPVTTPAVPALPAGYTTLNLPDGTSLNVPETGIENQLATFIADSTKKVDKTTWFNFDRLTFDTGKDTLQPSSQEQLNNVAAILKAYPDVHARIGGYTDNKGNARANLKLSAARAKNVMDALVAAGIDKSRLDSKGYGAAHPVASNDTEDGRAQNRRIALLVTKK